MITHQLFRLYCTAPVSTQVPAQTADGYDVRVDLVCVAFKGNRTLYPRREQSPGRTVRTLFRTLTGHFGHHRTCIPDSFRTDHRTVTGQSPDRSDMNRTQIGQRQARQCPMRPSDSSDSPDTIGHRRTPSDTIGQCEM